MTRAQFVFALVGAIAAMSSVPVTRAEVPGGWSQFLGQLEATDTVGREQALVSLYEERERGARVLIGMLDRSKPAGVRAAAAYLLGAYRMEQGVPALAPMLTFEYQREDVTKRLPLWGRYPVAEALARIGMPAVPLMVENLASSDDPKVRQLSLSVVRVASNGGVARLILEWELGKETDGRRRDRLRAAVQQLEQHQQQ